MVTQRLGRLSDDCRGVLEVAAVLGRGFQLRALQLASGRDVRQLLELLEEAEAARVVEAAPGGPASWRFVHTLVREVLYAGLPAARRVRLHGRVGEALEAVYAADLGPHLAELAHHFVAAAPAGEETVARAVQVATLAGRRALELLAWEEAAGLFAHALAVLELAEEPDQGERCELLLALGETGMAASDVAAARAAYQQAGELARRIGAPGGSRQSAPWAWGWSTPPGWLTRWRLGCWRRRWRPSARMTVRCGHECWPGWPRRYCSPHRLTGG